MDELRSELLSAQDELHSALYRIEEAIGSVQYVLEKLPEDTHDYIAVSLTDYDWRLVIKCLAICHTVLDKYGWDMPGLSPSDRPGIAAVLTEITEQSEKS